MDIGCSVFLSYFGDDMRIVNSCIYCVDSIVVIIVFFFSLSLLFLRVFVCPFHFGWSVSWSVSDSLMSKCLHVHLSKYLNIMDMSLSRFVNGFIQKVTWMQRLQSIMWEWFRLSVCLNIYVLWRVGKRKKHSRTKNKQSNYMQ